MKKPRTQKTKAKPDKPASKQKAAPAAAAKAAVGHNSADPKLRELFLQHKGLVDKAQQQLNSANGKLRAAIKAAKVDGFSSDQFKVARQLETPEGEAEFKAKVGKQLQAAQFIGSSLGSQLDMFLEPDRTDSADRAYDEGQKASMENVAAVPAYAPGTKQYESYMKGFHDHQAGISKGFKTVDKGANGKSSEKAQKPPRASAAAKEPAPTPPAAGAAEPPPPAAAPSSGQPLSRAEYNRLQEAQQGESEFTKAGAG